MQKYQERKMGACQIIGYIRDNMKTFEYQIPDYEHSGDLDWAEEELKRLCPDLKNLKKEQERDYEQEREYENEYGEIDEPIYRGYIVFDAPDKYIPILLDYGCYVY